MAAHPGGLCAPRVRSEGNRNTAEPCTRLPGAGRRDPSRFLWPGGPRTRPPALRPRQRGDPGPSPRLDRASGVGAPPRGPLPSTPAAAVVRRRRRRGPAAVGAPFGLRGSVSGVRPGPARGLRSVSAPRAGPELGACWGRTERPRRAALARASRSSQASARQPRGLLGRSLGHLREISAGGRYLAPSAGLRATCARGAARSSSGQDGRHALHPAFFLSQAQGGSAEAGAHVPGRREEAARRERSRGEDLPPPSAVLRPCRLASAF